MILETDKYTYRVTWSDEDGEFVGLCAEFPGLSWLSVDPEEALKGVRALVKNVVEEMVQTGETFPSPISSRQFSGKFMVRIPPEVHRHLATEAAEAGVSLNRIASVKLAQ
ncbi:MAG: putative HicB family RNase H-like nuclease [Rhodothermales bacterium]|jgi:predicted HicB family RNase H-like nuclease